MLRLQSESSCLNKISSELYYGRRRIRVSGSDPHNTFLAQRSDEKSMESGEEDEGKAPVV